MAAYGHAGTPVVVFPTSRGRFHEFEDRDMVSALGHHLREGWIRLYCVDSVDDESWYNYGASPRGRVERHLAYDRYLTDEVVPLIAGQTGGTPLMTAGCSFGGYHAAAFAMRHPDLAHGLVSLSGVFDIHQFILGYYDDDCYLVSPQDFIPGLQDGWTLESIRRMKIVLGAGDWDICRPQTERFSQTLWQRGIAHTLAVWGDGQKHDWPLWQRQIAHYLAP